MKHQGRISYPSSNENLLFEKTDYMGNYIYHNQISASFNNQSCFPFILIFNSDLNRRRNVRSVFIALQAHGCCNSFRKTRWLKLKHFQLHEHREQNHPCQIFRRKHRCKEAAAFRFHVGHVHANR